MSLFPHTVTLFRLPRSGGEAPHATVLEGVLLEERAGAAQTEAGLDAADEARLFIPFGVSARAVPGGEARRYLPPADFEAAPDKEELWSLDGRWDWAFVKGEAAPEIPAGQRVYTVRQVLVRDLGGLKHWEIAGV